jgi:acyl-coenzyme A synthetase/AMP-(fatty) acid ligase
MDFDYRKMSGKFNPETKVWEGVKIPYPFPLDIHVSELVLEGLKKTPNRVIQLNYDDGTEMTCDELRVKMIRMAQNMRQVGIKEDDVVGIVCENSVDLMVFVNAIYQLGAIVGAMSVIHCKEDLGK